MQNASASEVKEFDFSHISLRAIAALTAQNNILLCVLASPAFRDTMIDSWRALAFGKDKIAITAAIDALLMAIHGYKPFYFADGFGHRDAFRIAIIPIRC